MPDKIDIWGDRHVEDARLLGLMIGDGCCVKQCTQLALGDDEVFTYVKERYDINVVKEFTTKKGSMYRAVNIRKMSNVFRQEGIFGKTKYNKTLPINIHEYTKESVCELLGGYFDADGSVMYNDKKNSVRICLTSIVKSLLEEVKFQLYKLGIHSIIVEEKRKSTTFSENTQIFRLYINREQSVKEFYKNISFLCKHKQESLEKVFLISRGKSKRTGLNGIKFNISDNGKGKFFIDKSLNNLHKKRILKIEYIGKKMVYNLTAGDTHTYLGANFITFNTGGEADLSKDAVDVLSNPEAYDLLPMDWDLLENNIDPEFISWKRRRFATFFPGQMAYEDGFIKKKQKFTHFLNIKDKELDKIKIHVTNWENNTKLLLKNIEDAKKVGGSKGKLLEQQKRVQYPIDPEDCFMSTEDNIFPGMEAQIRKNILLETGDLGKKVFLYEDSNGKISYDLSTKDLADYPHKGGFIDSPGIMFEELPLEKPIDYLYLAGFDDYKQEESGTDSIGSFYIYKINIGSDKWCGRIVYSISARPDPHFKLYNQVFLAMKAYNAKCFMENADMGFKEFLDRKRVTEMWLIESYDFKTDGSISKSMGRRRYGWTPTPENIRFFKGLLKNYLERGKTIVVDEEDVQISGIDLINEIGLLDEIISYKPDRNVDRITAFMSCLAYEYYAFNNYLLPTTEQLEKKRNQEKKPEVKRQKTLFEDMFGSGSKSIF